MAQTPPHFFVSFAAHQPSNKIAIIEEKEYEDEDFSRPSMLEMREMCDDVFDTKNEGDLAGGSATLLNAPRMDYMRHAAELPLKFYNDTNSRSFELVKVCKINVINCVFYAVTFKAKEGPSGDVLLFRGVVDGFRALYCDIKDDDKIKLLPDDNDCAGSLENHFRLLRIDDDDGDSSREAEFEEWRAMVGRSS